MYMYIYSKDSHTPYACRATHIAKTHKFWGRINNQLCDMSLTLPPRTITPSEGKCCLTRSPTTSTASWSTSESNDITITSVMYSVHMHTCILYVRIYMYMYYMYIHIHVYVLTLVCVHVRVRMYCMYVCTYI